MDIVYVYQRKRKDFGRHCYFSDRSAEVIVDITPDDSLRSQYVLKDITETGVQNTKEFSEHEVSFSFTSIYLYILLATLHLRVVN